MGKLIHFVAQSADGFIHGPNGEFDWPVMGPELSAYSRRFTETAGMFLYGRVVYEMMAGFWPKAEEYSDDPHDHAFAPIWREFPKAVFSNTLQSADWNTKVVKGDLKTAVADLKASVDGDLVLFGGSALANALTREGLVDEYQISVHPVVLGGGQPTFDGSAGRFDLKLLDAKVYDGKVTLFRYAPA
ncbi:dihydrofolate reductase family protein [Salininema proteolyticum]|uniref:Dihydrofolate reductase family protein n=1 Tax=Salininema proteolyticum TaxID=1607685 RepID=A0ABV8U1F8_9ACTN